MQWSVIFFVVNFTAIFVSTAGSQVNLNTNKKDRVPSRWTGSGKPTETGSELLQEVSPAHQTRAKSSRRKRNSGTVYGEIININSTNTGTGGKVYGFHEGVDWNNLGPHGNPNSTVINGVLYNHNAVLNERGTAYSGVINQNSVNNGSGGNVINAYSGIINKNSVNSGSGGNVINGPHGPNGIHKSIFNENSLNSGPSGNVNKSNAAVRGLPIIIIFYMLWFN